MDELRGEQGTWQFDGESVLITYHDKRSQDPLLRRLGRCRVPLAALTGAELHPEAGGKRWSLRLVLREGADPYAAAGAMLAARARPFWLTGAGDAALLGEFWADQLTAAARELAGRSADPPDPGALARQLVPPLPVHIRSSEGTAAFDGRAVRLTWVPSAPPKKRRQRVREVPLAEVLRVEWVPTDGWEWDLFRVVTPENRAAPEPDPKRDLFCLRCYPGKEGAGGLLLAATVTAHLAGHRPAALPAGGAGPAALPAGGPGRAGDLLAMLDTLHHEGLLTDAELAAKQEQLRARGGGDPGVSSDSGDSAPPPTGVR